MSVKLFLEQLTHQMGMAPPTHWASLDEVGLARVFLSRLNAYLYQTYEEIGTTTFNGEELRYFSEFHKFWEANHERIINAQTDNDRAAAVAQCLRAAKEEYGPTLFHVTQETRGLSREAIAQVRFFTANQDFREPPRAQFEKYFEDPGRFDAQHIADDPANFLAFLDLGRLSQSDKRADFARNAAQFLVERQIPAFGIAEHYGNDARVIRDSIVSSRNMGYGLKKANMFVRDMVEFGVWTNLTNLEAVDVASDINTMKVALRTGVVRTDTPLLSSFLDIFCHQYACIDTASSAAWRAVWEAWRDTDPLSAPASPSHMDFVLYRIGRDYCKEMVTYYACERGHSFCHFGRRLKNCRRCPSSDRVPASPVGACLPCQVDSEDLPRESDGTLLLPEDNLLRQFDGVCIFAEVCRPLSPEFRALEPPKSISIKGQTGWTSAYSHRDKGGGGLMS